MFINGKFAIILTSLTCFAAVNAAPQIIDYDAILPDSPPTPTLLPVTITATQLTATVNTASAAAAATSAAVVQQNNPDLAATNDNDSSDGSSGSSDLSKRDVSACKAQKTATYPPIIVNPDTPDAFQNNPQFSAAAEQSIPANYNRVGGQAQYNAAIGSMGWYGYNTLATYDVTQCAKLCDDNMKCEGFNLYYERDPSTDPADANCNNKNPPSITNIKCILHGYKFNPSNFKNVGQMRGNFQTVAAGSVGYLKKSVTGLAPSFDGFGLDNLVAQNCTIDAPLDPKFTVTATGKSYDTFIQSAWFTGDSNLANCYNACKAHTQYTLAHDADGKQSPCNYFTAYHIYKNGNFYQTMCGLYTRDWSDLSSPAMKNNICTNFGQNRGADTYTIAQSYDFTVLNYGTKSRTDLAPGYATTPDRGF